MPAPYSGRCLCGSVRKGAGGTNQIIAKFTHDDVRVSDELGSIREYTLSDTASGAPKIKSFCGTCGCTLWTVPQSAKGKFLIIRTSLIDGGFDLRPGSEIFAKNRPSWMSQLEGVPQFAEARK
ncbi:hypothetical protein S40285_10399 [Stachybotrys chlorohalonatus IBT 40285]|uniref:CENP-V/GFA domain-containing protein n=1 Tax=Stachybotrys chlorohalonatus (strain IBT 40285) TaxID=1283841 RepID=A0A084QPB4_STAC4|nr:hypothetical protein S40285_10399 [Stachybotrys chlorohalonata IBT 40285]